MSDIIAVDAIAFNTPDLISRLPPEHFEYSEFMFVVNTADGKTVDLKKDGSNIKVTYVTFDNAKKVHFYQNGEQGRIH